MKKILVNYTGRTAGGPAYAYEMTKALVENGAHVCAVISKSVCNLSDWEKLPIRLYKIDTYTSKKEFLFNTIKFCLLKGKLKKDLLKEEFDFIYVPMATYWTSIINGLLSNIPVCYTVHDPIMHSGEGIFNKIMFRQYSRDIHKANLLVVLSKSFIEPVSKIYNKEIENIIYIPHGAFWEYKKYGNNFNHKIVSYDEDKINFLFFGRIEEYKGIDVLLDAYQKLENYYPQKTSLTIAGRGDIAKYQNKINKFESVYVLNRMILDSEISSLYAGNNIVTVLPYKDATQSGVIPTAQIFNSLIIASDVGAIREQLDDGKLGILIKPNDVEALYLAMKMVVSNIYDSEYKDMKDKGYVFVKKLKWNVLGKKLLECISFFSYKEV